MERLCDFKIYALSVLGYIGSISAPDGATLKEEAHASQCTTASPYDSIPTDLRRAASVCGLRPDMLGIHTLSLAARFRTASDSGTLTNGLAKIQAAREYDNAPIFALRSEWKEKFLKPSMAHSTMEAPAIVRRLDHYGKLDESPQDKKQKAATALLRDEFQKQDFAKPVSLRVSRILGPVSRFRIAQILPQMKLASRASRPGLTVGFLRILCSGLCRRFHAEGEEQMCRIECPDEPDSLLHYNECPLLYNFFASVRKRAIVVMGVIDAFVDAHNHHRRNMDNPGNFGDCMKGRIRFMRPMPTRTS